MNEKGFDFSAFITEWKETLLNPKSYFSTMRTEGGIAEPIIKALIYGAAAGIFYFIWSMLHLSGYGHGFIGGVAGISALFTSVIGAVIGVFIGGVVVLVLSAISEGNKEYEACLRVAAGLIAVFPVSAFLSFFSGLNAEIGTLVGLAINIYSLYLLYLGLTLALKGNEKTVKIIAFVIGGLLILLIVVSLITSFAIRSYRGFNEGKAEKMIEKYQNIAEKAAADYQKAAEEIADAQNEVAEYEMPDAFPSEAIKHVQKSFATGSPKITRETIENLIAAKQSSDQSEDALKQYGFPTKESYAAAYISVISGIEALHGLNALQQIIDAEDQEKVAAEAYTLDQATLAIANQSIITGKLTQKDLHTIYDNWDLAMELKNTSK